MLAELRAEAKILWLKYEYFIFFRYLYPQIVYI